MSLPGTSEHGDADEAISLSTSSYSSLSPEQTFYAANVPKSGKEIQLSTSTLHDRDDRDDGNDDMDGCHRRQGNYPLTVDNDSDEGSEKTSGDEYSQALHPPLGSSIVSNGPHNSIALHPFWETNKTEKNGVVLHPSYSIASVQPLLAHARIVCPISNEEITKPMSSSTQPAPFVSCLRRSKASSSLSPSHQNSRMHLDDTDESAETYVSSFPKKQQQHDIFTPSHISTLFLERISRYLLKREYSPYAAATWIGFWALLHVTCANYVLTPIRDAIALQVGVEHIPVLTLVSTILAFLSSVPIGWLFEAPDPNRRRLWKRMGLTRGETQGTSLALFFRCFALCLLSYAVGFSLVEWLASNATRLLQNKNTTESQSTSSWLHDWPALWITFSKVLYIAFFLVVHLMKLHCLSLMWGVTTEAMEYEEVARKKNQSDNKSRLQRLAFVGFGGTLGGILGSGLASSMAQLLRLPGLLVLSALLLEISAELSIELGRIMKKHWEEQQLFQSSNDLASLDTSMKRSESLGSMKRVASGNSLYRIKSATDLNQITPASASASASPSTQAKVPIPEEMNDNTFAQRLLRGVTTILRSRLLMAIFTYNALYASTTVLLSFQRAELVANRKNNSTTEADTAFLANINMASSIAIFVLQATGAGALLANACGPRGTLTLMPLIRLIGVLALAWWHHVSSGQPPNLLIFLFVDECTKIMNLAVAKPVRESLWRGLSNEARYEAKPIVDTIANRWGGGSAAFLVSFLHRTLSLLGVQPGNGGIRNVFGFPPVLFLCLIVASWWAVVSADLGHIRKRIDLELKKRQ